MSNRLERLADKIIESRMPEWMQMVILALIIAPLVIVVDFVTYVFKYKSPFS